MQITPEQRTEALEQASTTAVQLYSAPASGGRLREIFERHQLSEEAYKTYALTVGNIILGFYPVEELSQQLKNELKIDKQAADNLAEDLREFLAPLEIEELESTTDLEEEIAETEQALQAATGNRQDKEVQEKTQPKTPSIPQVRTMQDDAQIAQGGQPEERVVHATGQDDLLRRTPTEKPAAAAPDTPESQPQQQSVPETPANTTSKQQEPSAETEDTVNTQPQRPTVEGETAPIQPTSTDHRPEEMSEETESRPQVAAQHKPIEDIVIPTKAPEKKQIDEGPGASQPATPQPQPNEAEPKSSLRWESEQT